MKLIIPFPRIILIRLVLIFLGSIFVVGCGDQTITSNSTTNGDTSGGGDGGGGDGGGGDGGGGDGGGGDGGGGDGTTFYDRCPPDDASALAVNQNIDHLIITEFSPMAAINRSVWFEVFNPTSQPIQLGNIQLKSYTMVSDQSPTSNDIDLTPTLFNLPDNTLGPYEHLIIESVIAKQVTYRHSKPSGDVLSTKLVVSEPINTQHHIRLASNHKTFFWRHDAGMIELIDKQTGNTIDFIHFGNDTQLPTSVSQWSGDAIPVYQHPEKITSIARITPYQDHNNLNDWSLSTFQTPTGENLTFPMVAGKMDLTLNSSNADLDKDGIPDSKEVDCAYFNGLPYYGWGARPNQTDIYVQIDYMEDNPAGSVTDLMKPSLAALKKWEDIYIKYSPTDLNHASGPLYPLRIHLDTGILHANAGEQNKINTAQFNLYATNTTRRGGTVIPFQASISLDSDLPDFALSNMDSRRYGIFHYTIIGYELAGAYAGALGVAYPNSQNSLTVLGSRDRASNQNNRGPIDTILASTAAHEVGHNLSLEHGGFESANYKPNYYSIMNYGYSDDMVRSGLVYTTAEIDKIKNAHKKACNGSSNYFRFSNHDLDKAYYNFSDGTGLDIDLSNIDESQQFLNQQLGFQQIDYNGNDSIETSMSCKIANQSTWKTLKDNNDWVQMRDGAFPTNHVSSKISSVNGLPISEPEEVVICDK